MTRILAVLLALTAALGAWQTVRLADERAAHAEAKAAHAAVLAGLAQRAAEVADKARKAEQAQAIAASEAQATLDKAKTDAKKREAALVADLRAERRKLRDFWTQGAGTCGVSGADAADGAGEDPARLRAEAVGRIAGIGAEANGRVNFLLTRLDIAERLCGPKP